MYIRQGTREFWRASTALFAGGFSTFAILYCTQPLMPEFTREFQAAPASASLSVSAATITMAVSMLFIGALSDNWGRKNFMALTILAASILCVLLAFSPSFPFLLVTRIAQGMLVAVLPAIAMTYLAEEFDRGSLGYAMGLYISGTSIGGMAGRIIIGFLTDWFNWRVAVAMLGLISVASAIAFWILLPASRHFHRRPLAIGNVLPLLLSQCRDRRLLSLYALGFLLMGGFVTMFNYIGYVLTGEPYHLSQSLLGSLFLVYLTGTVSSTWMGKLSDTMGRSVVFAISLLIMAGGALFTLSGSLWMKIAGLALFAFGFFGGHSIASSWVGLVASPQARAQASALYLFFYYIGSSVSGTSGGLLYSSFGWAGIVSLVACQLICAAGICAVLYRTQRAAG
jgi:YNFM family putative membrane transporter